ncbi:MAG: hypothetical protein ABMA01_01690 [Chthoniobacteraceae bacterium]
MYPLLVSAVSTIASNAIDTWLTSRASKAPASTENFAALLEKNAATPMSAAASRDTQILSLRQHLLDSPEVRTLLASADPAKQPVLSLAADGTLTAQTSDGRTTTVSLSPQSITTARHLAALTGPAGQLLPTHSAQASP